MTKTIIGLFEDRSDAESTIAELKDDGYNPKDFSVVMRDTDSEETRDFEDTTGTDVAGGALTGATTGAIAGGGIGFLAGTVFPGLAGFLIGGPIGAALGLTGAAATTVSGAITGAVAGGLIGALMGLGLSKPEAEHYQSRIEQGAIFIAVPIRGNEEARVTDVFDSNNASDVKVIAHDRVREDRDHDDNDDRTENKSHHRLHFS